MTQLDISLSRFFRIISILVTVMLLIPAIQLQAQDDNKKDRQLINWSDLPFMRDDIQLIGGINTSGIYWSNNFKELSYAHGFQFGIELYQPMDRIMFINYGIHFSQRNFTHDIDHVTFTSNYLDAPLFFSFELPELRDIDLRFILGVQASYQISSNQQDNYSEQTLANTKQYIYSSDKFNQIDFGWAFGLSAEYKNIYFRARSYVGINKLMPNEQGMMNSFNFDVGYFIFRPFRKI